MTDTLTKGSIYKDDFSLWSGDDSYTGSRKTSTGGTQTLKRIDWPGVDVYAIKNAKTKAAIDSAVSDIGSSNASLWLAPGEWTITSSLTLASNINIDLAPGATINVSAGQTLTIGGHFNAIPEQVFTGTGTVVFSTNSEILADWFGASKNYTTLNAMLSVVGSTQNYRVKLSRGTWTIDDDLDLSSYGNLELFIPNGCLLSISNTKTLTFASSEQINATGLCQIFDGTGNIAFDAGGKVNVKWWGAIGDGSTDDTSAFTNCLSMITTENITIRVPAGDYVWTSTVTISHNRLNFIGDGKDITRIVFEPTGNDVCLYVSDGASTIGQGTIKDISFFTTDTTNTKTAILLSDIQTYNVHNVRIYGSTDAGTTNLWGGSNSIGLKTMGRDSHSFRDVTIQAEKPIVVSDNPNSVIDIDHYNFHNLYLLGDTTNPLITIDDGVNLTQVSFTGYQPWVKGSYGLYWNDTTTVGVSIGLFINNVRLEQGGTNDYAFYISHNFGLSQLTLNNIRSDINRKGIYLRTVDDAAIHNYQYPSTTLEALNVDSTVRRISIQNCFWQAGSTATVTGQTMLMGSPKNPLTGPIPPNILYDESSHTDKDLKVDAAMASNVITLANGATETLGSNMAKGLLVVINNTQYCGLFWLHGTGTSVTEISDPSNVFDVAAGVDTFNVYWDAGSTSYLLENNSGGSVNFKVMLIGSYSSW